MSDKYNKGIRPHIDLKYVPMFLYNKPIPDIYLQIGRYRQHDPKWYTYLLKSELFELTRKLEVRLHKNGTLSWLDWDLISIIHENGVYMDVGSLRLTDYKQYFNRKILDRLYKASERMRKKRAVQAVIDKYLNDDVGSILHKFTNELYSEFWTRHYS